MRKKEYEILEPITINEDEVLILKLEVLLHPRDVENIRNNIIQQLEGGVVMIPKGMQYTICKREELEHERKLIKIDTWVDKLKRIINDPEAPEEYKDYCMHLINEINAEFQAQQPED